MIRKREQIFLLLNVQLYVNTVPKRSDTGTDINPHQRAITGKLGGRRSEKDDPSFYMSVIFLVSFTKEHKTKYMRFKGSGRWFWLTTNNNYWQWMRFTVEMGTISKLFNNGGSNRLQR